MSSSDLSIAASESRVALIESRYVFIGACMFLGQCSMRTIETRICWPLARSPLP